MNKKNKKSIIFLRVILVIFIQIILIAAFSIVLIYHGPFTKLKNSIVVTAMNTNQQKYWATLFLSSDEIKKIMDKSNATFSVATQNIDEIKVKPQKLPEKNLNESKTEIENQIKSNVTIEDVSGKNFKGKLMTIKDPSIVHVGVAKNIGTSGNRLSEIIADNNALGGVNAGGFLDDNFVQNGALPGGIVIVDGKIVWQQKDLKNFDVIGFNYKNELVISNSMTLDQINKSNLRCAVSFGPELIVNGKSLVTSGGVMLNPRTVIGQKKDGTVLIMVVDGRESESAGATYKIMANLMLKYGAYNAANLDGGSSSTMYWDKKIINNPCDILGERSIPTAFIIK